MTNAHPMQAKVFGTSYEPSLEWWTANQKAYVKPDPKDDPLPDGFPEIAESPSLWDGKVLINQRQFVMGRKLAITDSL
jgi:hypothetical protein